MSETQKETWPTTTFSNSISKSLSGDRINVELLSREHSDLPKSLSPGVLKTVELADVMSPPSLFKSDQESVYDIESQYLKEKVKNNYRRDDSNFGVLSLLDTPTSWITLYFLVNLGLTICKFRLQHLGILIVTIISHISYMYIYLYLYPHTHLNLILLHFLS